MYFETIERKGSIRDAGQVCGVRAELAVRAEAARTELVWKLCLLLLVWVILSRSLYHPELLFL